MGVYSNGTTAYTLYKNERVEPYFVDKTNLLEDFFLWLLPETSIFVLPDHAVSAKR